MISGLIMVIAVSGFVFPVVAKVLQDPVKEAALISKREGYKVVMWHIDMPSFSVYSQQIVPSKDPEVGEVVLTKTQYLDELKSYEMLYSKNGISLVRVTQ